MSEDRQGCLKIFDAIISINPDARVVIRGGDIDTCEPTGANTVSEGDYITLTTNGASTNTHTADFTIVIRR